MLLLVCSMVCSVLRCHVTHISFSILLCSLSCVVSCLCLALIIRYFNITGHCLILSCFDMTGCVPLHVGE